MGSEGTSGYVTNHTSVNNAANSYGYFWPGFNPSSDQAVGYNFVQPQGLPYTYYVPSIGYAYSTMNQQSGYFHRPIIGFDGQIMEPQQYNVSPTYQLPPYPCAYFPVYCQPTADFGSNGQNGSIYGKFPSKNVKSLPHSSVNASFSSGGGPSSSEHSQSCHDNPIARGASERPNIPVSQKMPSSLDGGAVPCVASKTDENHVTSASSAGNTLTHVVSDVPLISEEEYIMNDTDGSSNRLSENTKGARTSQPKGSILTVSDAAVENSHSNAAVNNSQSDAASPGSFESIMIYSDQYNRENFPLHRTHAKFFVIKSFSEDDVHKSIKYNVWSSSPTGNKRLNDAYAHAQELCLGNAGCCPVFLFFSVNTSGYFCGLAEMTGSVDFRKDMDFWHQDRWSGSFPLKWHIIKDVPNSKLRHIMLENNENKPVTSSRDTQEIPFEAGMNMLKLFKDHPLATCLLDDFPFYEERQKLSLIRKCRRQGITFDESTHVQAFIATGNTGILLERYVKEKMMEAQEGTLDRSSKRNSTRSQNLCKTVPVTEAEKQCTDPGVKFQTTDEKRTDEPSGQPQCANENQPGIAMEEQPVSCSSVDLGAAKCADNAIHKASKVDGRPFSLINLGDMPARAGELQANTKDLDISNDVKNGKYQPVGNEELTASAFSATHHDHTESGFTVTESMLLKVDSVEVNVNKPGDNIKDTNQKPLELNTSACMDDMKALGKMPPALESLVSSEAKKSAAEILKVGSVQIKVEGGCEASSEIINLGPNTIRSKGKNSSKKWQSSSNMRLKI